MVPNLLGNVATSQRVAVQSVYNHSNVQPVYDVYASVQDRDLGSAAAAIENVVQEMRGRLGPADRIVIRGQIASMHQAFGDLSIGLLFAAVFVYALMVVNYQSFIDPLAVILALPGAGSGIILHAVRHRNDVQRAVADGRDHGGGRRLGELHPAGHLRARAARGRHERVPGRAFRRPPRDCARC